MIDNAIPTDSVLRRHYEATHSGAKQNKGSQGSSGLMCWLKRLFGG